MKKFLLYSGIVGCATLETHFFARFMGVQSDMQVAYLTLITFFAVLGLIFLNELSKEERKE